MSSFKEEVEKTRQMLENVNRRLTGTDDVVYFRPPIQIRLKKTNPNKSFKLFTSNYKTKTFDKLEYDRKKYIEFVCKHPDCDYDIITVFKVKSKILPENVYIFSGDKNSMPEYGPTNIFDTLDATCPCFLLNMTPVPNSIFCMWFFRTSRTSLFFGFVFDFFFCF